MLYVVVYTDDVNYKDCFKVCAVNKGELISLLDESFITLRHVSTTFAASLSQETLEQHLEYLKSVFLI